MAIRINADGSMTVGIIPDAPEAESKAEEPIKVEKPKKAKTKKGEG